MSVHSQSDDDGAAAVLMMLGVLYCEINDAVRLTVNQYFIKLFEYPITPSQPLIEFVCDVQSWSTTETQMICLFTAGRS